MAKVRSGIDDLVRLLEMVDEKEENGEEFSEEELKQAFIREEVLPSGEITGDPVSLDLTTTMSGNSSSTEESSPSPLPSEQLTNGTSSSLSTTPPQPSTTSTSSSVQCNGSSANGTVPVVVVEDIPNGEVEPENETKDHPEESADGPDPINNPNDLDVNLTINSGNSINDHSITRGNNGRSLYHCNVCTAVYRHSFSLKRHFIRTHINYAFLSDGDLGNCSIHNLNHSDSYLAWISRVRTSRSTPPTLSVPVPIDAPSTSNGHLSSVNEVDSTHLDSPSTSTASARSIVAPNQPPKSKGLYCCHACVMFFDRIRGLREHLASVHLNDSTGSLEPVRLPCHRCDATFIHRLGLDEHISVVHAIDQPSTSSASPSASSSSSSSGPRSSAAKTTKTNKGKRKKGSSSYSTSSSSSSGCDRKNSSSEEKCDDDDSRSSPERNPITCELCPYRCESLEQLKKHNSVRHPPSMFKCAYCKILFVEKKHLIEHLSGVHGKSLVANSRLLKSNGESTSSLSVASTSRQSTGVTVPPPSSTPAPSTATAQRSKNLISTRSHKRRCVNRRGANYDENAYDDDLFECHECFETFSYATELLKHAETVHNPSRNTRSSSNSVSDADFYGSLAQKISENLLYHVDGIPKNQALTDGTNEQDHKPTTTPNPSPTYHFVELNLQDYNFPPGFQLYPDNDDQDGSAFDGELTNSTEQVNNTTTNSDIDPKETKPEKEEGNHKTDSTINTDNNNNNNNNTTTVNNSNNGCVIDCFNNQSPSKPGRIIYICDACGNQFDSLELFDQHEINNHPNVFCSYTEIDSNHNIPIGIFKNQVYSPNGILKSCKVPVLASSTSDPSIKCTKCQNKFSTASDLYKHILECSSKSKRKTKPPTKAPTPPPSPSTSTSSTSSSSTETLSMAITPSPTAISTSNNINNQNKKPKPTNSPHQQPSSPSLTPTPATPSPDSVPSSSTSILSNCSSSSSSSSKKAQQSPAKVSSTPSTRRSGQQGNRSTPDADSILASLSYNTRSSAKRKLDDTDMDGDCGFSLVKKRNRKARYVCPHCDQVFTHHLTFAKHSKECESKDQTVTHNSDKFKKSVNNATSTAAPSALASSPSKSTKRQARIESLKQRYAKRNTEHQKKQTRRGKARKGPIGKATRGDKR